MPIRMELRTPLMELKADYEYMEKIGVHRASERPKHRWLVALSMLPLIAAEAWINGSFLARGLENGLIGGWTIAAAISLFNVVLLGFFCGAFGRRQAKPSEARVQGDRAHGFGRGACRRLQL